MTVANGKLATTAPALGGKVSASYALYALILLTCINIIASVDRRVINIIAEPIRNELGLFDWQLGMLTGLAFAAFYAVLGLPIARIADRSNRPLVIVSSLTVWSGFTALSAAAGNFIQLFLFRMGVGVGEAGCSPPAQSLITDYVPREKRASSLAVWAMGVPLGALFGFAIGGLAADQYGWRMAFLVAGLPGLVLAALAILTLKETRSKLREDVAAAKANQPKPRELFKILRGKRTYWMIIMAVSMGMVNSYGMQAFIVSFFLRNHEAGVAQLAASFGLQSVGFLGLVIGLSAGFLGAVSIFIGGRIADWTGARDVRNMMIAPAAGALLAMPLAITALLIDNVVIALIVFTLPQLLNGFGNGPVYATMQSIVKPNMRASSASLALFLEIIIGQAGGPVVVGIVSDVLATTLGAGEGLRWSLICSACMAIPAAHFYLAARKTMREDFES